MSTLILDSDHNDDSLYINEEQGPGYVSPFVLDVLYPSNNNMSEWSSKEEDPDFDMMELQAPQAPPPSPQSKPILDMLFPQQLNLSLEATTTETNDFSDQWSRALTNLLSTTKDNQKLFKRSYKQKMVAPLRSTSTKGVSSWQTKPNIQKLETVAEATKYSKQLKRASLNKPYSVEEKIISKLRDMGL